MSSDQQMNQTASLYDRLGLSQLIGVFYERVLADKELAPFFAHSPMDKLRHMQTEFFAAALGGPQKYSGLSLAWAHSGRGIATRHFARFAEHLLAVLREQGVNEADAREVIARINTHASDITGEAGRDS
jgi:hemoglobin